jgi:hypothetical protein
MRILTAPLSDDERPVLSHGPNWIAYFDGPGGASACGNTEAEAVAKLIARAQQIEERAA